MKILMRALIVALLLAPGLAVAQTAPAPDMISLRFAGWSKPVRLERREANSIIFTVFVKHGFGGWIPLDDGPEYAAFRGDSIGLAPPDGDMISIDLDDPANGEQLAHTRLARMRPAADGGFEPEADLSDTAEAKTIFAEIEAGLLAAR